MRHPSRRAHAAALLVLAALLHGCAGAPSQQDTQAPPPVVETQQPDPGVSLALPPSAYRAQFNAAEQALAGFDWMQASLALEALPATALDADDTAYLHYLRARIAWVRGARDSALDELQQARAASANPALIYRSRTFAFYMFSLRGEHIRAAQEATQLLQLVPEAQRADWKRHAWRELNRADTGALRAALEQDADTAWLAWLQLALDCREPDPAAAVDAWLARHAQHPAANPLPGGLHHLQPAASGPRRTALLLPLSGRLAPAGRAVLDGYLAAHYAAAGRGDATAELLVFDLGSQSADGAYQAAVSQGASMVIGPLSKESVAQLAARERRPVPVLALNRLDGPAPPAAGSALVQLALAPEDEAATLAQQAYGDGGRLAMIIRPQGAWGEKVERALRERWRDLGGRVVSAATYGEREDYSRGVKDALGVSASEQRARQVRDMLATNIEFTPRRREDPDVVFLLSADGAEARSIKPLLAFHYAGGLPVYALSSVYSGVPDARNRDLDGLHLVETPWLLGASPELRVAIAAGATGSASYTRLNALGVDAYLLGSQFARLRAGPDALLRGTTGLLDMDPQLRIHRELSPATFDKGEIRPL